MKEKMQAEDFLKQAKRLGVYRRVSTKEQDNEKRQNQKLEDYLNRQGIRLDDTEPFEDTKSAYRLPYGDRENFIRLIEAAKAKEIDGVVVSDIDRISRQTSEHFELRKLFHELGLPVIIASKGEVYTKPENHELVKQLIEDGFTKLESDNISVRTKDALEKIRREKQFAGGAIPYGFIAITKTIGNEVKVSGVSEVDEEIQVIKKIFRLYQGGLTFQKIASVLHRDGDPIRLKKDGTKKEWCAKKVKYILSNPFYTGHFVYNRKTKTQNFAPLRDWVWVPCSWMPNPPISKEQFLTCWRRYESSKEKNRYYLHSSYYFQDILRCQCGEYMKGVDQRTKSKRPDRDKDGYRYYVCRCGVKVMVQSLHSLFKKFYYGLSLPYENVYCEVYKRFERELEEKTSQLALYKEQLIHEKKVLFEMKQLPQSKKNKDIYISETASPLDIAVLIGKRQTEEAITTLEKEIVTSEYYIKSLNQYLESEEQLRDAVSAVLSFSKEVDEEISEDYEEESREDKRNAQLMRSIVLLMVKECQLISKNEVRLTFNMMPNEILSPVVTRKRAE